MFIDGSVTACQEHVRQGDRECLSGLALKPNRSCFLQTEDIVVVFVNPGPDMPRKMHSTTIRASVAGG